MAYLRSEGLMTAETVAADFDKLKSFRLRPDSAPAATPVTTAPVVVATPPAAKTN
ncbi:hypothetical protein CAOG_009613 [Capsaspora owczarzaki ATCC 30864]|uniref:Uncharacterized protein n=1 Tax=Capsaspora owczarzaki (strain ATCC 30864) TaxID=595528 RepID=A0A0D2UA48_CAPO3|nr:hypothetical protein CAOG_009613 [Capsaspora owczarzaki ATCC 30864]